jgi:hypothetical protein
MMFAKAGIPRDADDGVVDLDGGVPAFIGGDAAPHRSAH